MQAWLAPVAGTSLGLALVAFGAALVLPDKPVFDIAPMVQAWLRPPAPRPAPPPAATPAAPQAPAPAAAPPRPTPRAASPAAMPPPALPLPNTDVADLPGGIDGLLRRPPSGWSTGTGFFVSGGGTLLTAEHVVRNCGSVRVLSAHMRPETARVVAADRQNDVAVLEVPGLAAPAWLPVATPARGTARLAVFGFPVGSLPDTPNETWAGLSNDAFEPHSTVQRDPAKLVWFRSAAVGPGFSGGPLVDLSNGRVVAMVRGGIDSQRVPLLDGVATEGLGLGPGAEPMLAMLSRHTLREGVVPAGLSAQSVVERVRRATVRVVCEG